MDSFQSFGFEIVRSGVGPETATPRPDVQTVAAPTACRSSAVTSDGCQKHLNVRGQSARAPPILPCSPVAHPSRVSKGPAFQRYYTYLLVDPERNQVNRYHTRGPSASVQFRASQRTILSLPAPSSGRVFVAPVTGSHDRVHNRTQSVRVLKELHVSELPFSAGCSRHGSDPIAFESTPDDRPPSDAPVLPAGLLDIETPQPCKNPHPKDCSVVLPVTSQTSAEHNTKPIFTASNPMSLMDGVRNPFASVKPSPPQKSPFNAFSVSPSPSASRSTMDPESEISSGEASLLFTPCSGGSGELESLGTGSPDMRALSCHPSPRELRVLGKEYECEPKQSLGEEMIGMPQEFEPDTKPAALPVEPGHGVRMVFVRKASSAENGHHLKSGIWGRKAGKALASSKSEGELSSKPGVQHGSVPSKSSRKWRGRPSNAGICICFSSPIKD